MGRKENKTGRNPAGAPASVEFLAPGAPLPGLHRGLLLLLFTLLTLLALRQVMSPDSGYHLKAGNYILSGHGWPRMDTFTYTINDHPYTDTTWGYQILLALAEKAAGAPGMVLFHLAIVAAMFILLYKTARLAPADPAMIVLSLGMGIVACEPRFDIRPELLSYLFLSMLIYLLHRHAFGLKTRLWLLPVLLGVWANCHALFVLGWLALLCTVAGLWIRDRKPDERLLLWTGAAFVTPFVNPYGLSGVLFPFTLMTRYQSGNVFAQAISEFASPFSFRMLAQDPFQAHWPLWTFRLLAVLAVSAILLLLKRRKFWAAFLCLAFLPLEVKMMRNVPLLIVTAIPVLPWVLPVSGLGRFLRMRERRARFAGNIVLAAAGVLIVVLGMRVVTGAYYASVRRPDLFGWDWNRRMLPVDAAEYVKRAGLPGPMFNHLNFGGYLMWAVPQQVFIDGRLEVTGEDFFKTYQQILSSPEVLERAAEKYGFQWIILPYAVEPMVLAQISENPHWRLAYVDALAVIFFREGPGADRWTDRASIERPVPKAAELKSLPGLGGPERTSPLQRWLSGLVRPQRYPLEAKNMGVFHYFRKDYPRAEAWYRKALETGGEYYYEIYLNLAASLFRQGKFDEAAAGYAVVLQDDPENKVALDHLSRLTRGR